MKIFFDQGCCPLILNQDTTLDLPQMVPTFGLTHIYSSGEQNKNAIVAIRGGGGWLWWAAAVVELLDMTNLQIESCLKGYPATVCCADELRGSQAPHVHRQYGYVRPWWKSLGGVSLPLVGPYEFFDSLGNAPETYHRCFDNVNGPQYYTTVRLKSNPTTLTPALPVLLQTETSRKEDTILRFNC